MTLRRGVVISALWITTLLQSVSCSGLYAFWTEHAMQVGLQDPATGAIHHSNCNSEKLPIFPVDEPNVLETREKPRNGTSIAAVGWWDSKKIVASIFWQAESGTIVNGFYECNMTTGKYNRNGEYLISNTAKLKSIHNESGLSVELLGAEYGYRVFYHNEEGHVMMMSYTTASDWRSEGIVSQDPQAGMILSSAHLGKDDISVAFAQGEENVEVARLAEDPAWNLETFPTPLAGTPTNTSESYEFQIDTSSQPNFTLPSWDSETKAIGMAIDRSEVRSIFYIGTDKKLYQVVEGEDGWEMGSSQTEEEWPVADEPSSDLAVLYRQSEGEIWVYYQANGTLVEAYRGYYGNWTQAQSLPLAPPEEDDTPVNGTSVDDNKVTPPAEEPKSDSGLSTGAKVGIGIGVGVGVGSLLLAGLVFFLWKRRRNNQAPAPASDSPLSEVEGSTAYSSNAGLYSPQQDSVKVLEKTEPMEMPTPPPPAELDHTSQPVFHELPASNR